MSRYDAARDANSPEELPAGLQLAWSIDLPRLQPGWLDQPRLQYDSVYQPIVLDGRVIVSSPNDDSIAAYDLASGKELWRFMTGGPVRLPPAGVAGKIFAGSDDGWMYALNVVSGAVVWKFKGAPKERLVLGNGRMMDTWPVRGGPVVAEGKLYFAAGIWPFMGIFVHCLDAETGKVIWSNSGDGAAYLTQPHGAKAFSGIAPQGSMVLTGDRLLIPNGRAEAASYEKATGKMQYFAFANKFGGHDVVASDTLFFNGGLVFDLKDGKPTGSCVHSPVLAGDIAFGFSPTALLGYDMTTEIKSATAPKFKTTPRPRFMQSLAAPFSAGKTLIKAGSRLFAGGKGALAAFNLPMKPGQAPNWEISVEGTAAYLAASAGHLLMVTEEGRICCYAAGVEKTIKAETPVAAVAISASPLAATAHALLEDSHIDGGIGLVLGVSSLDLAREISAQGRLQLVVIEKDAAKVDAARQELRSRGLYGQNLAVIVGDIQTLALPPYFASFVLSTNANAGLDEDAARAIFRVLHPYRGVAYLAAEDKAAQAINGLVVTHGAEHATVAPFKKMLRLARIGGVPGAGNWTHENADAANTRVSKDTVVRAPLGLLWYGGSSHDGILPRHGHGPQPQVIDGRLIIEGMDLLRAMDIYTGRVLWETSLPGVGSFFNNLAHNPGANGTGTNYISMADGIYVAMDRACVRLDPATGVKNAEFALPADAPPGSIWGYLNVVGDYLIGGAAAPLASKEIGANMVKKKEDEDDDENKEDDNTAPKIILPRAISSRQLFVMDRKTGKVLWSTSAESEFRHNAVCAGGGRLFAIDRLCSAVGKTKISEDDFLGGYVRTFDLASGKELWRCGVQVGGTWLCFSEEYDVLVEAGRNARDGLKDESKGMRGFRASDGTLLWADHKAKGPAMIRGASVLKETTACDLLNGQPITYVDPLTGRSKEWTWTRMYGCNTPAASQNLITFRSGAAGYYDLDRNGGTGNFGGFRSSCTHNLLVAGGILCAPDYTRTCTCSYQLQTSVALVPDAEVEMWTYIGTSAEMKEPLKRVGVNLGAPGDRVDDTGTLWLEFPSTGGPSPKIDVKADPDKPDVFCQHSSIVSGPMPWVTASGMKKIKQLRIATNEKTLRAFTVRLYFSEPEMIDPGARVVDVSLQGVVVLKGLDIVAEAGGSHKSLIKEFRGVMVGAEFKVDLKPATPTSVPLLCGVELIAE